MRLGYYRPGCRIIDIQGRFKVNQPQAEGRLLELKDGLAYVVVPAEETDFGEPVLLSQVDIDALMRSKAAMYSILNIPLGNSSLAGAESMLTDESARKRCRDVVTRITYIELNVNQEFMQRFSGSRFIPHTDHTLFPSVPFLGES